MVVVVVVHKFTAVLYPVFVVFSRPDAELPMMMMDDCLKGTYDMMFADDARLTQRVYVCGRTTLSNHP